MSSNIITQTSLWGKQLGFRSILPISLQQIKYEKIHAVHSNELAQGYTLIPVSFFIDQYRGKHFKTPRFFTNFPEFALLWNLTTDISLKLDNNKKKRFYTIIKGPETLQSVEIKNYIPQLKIGKKEKNTKSDVFNNFENKKIAHEKKDDFMDTHQYICVFDKFSFFFRQPASAISRDGI